MSYLRKYNLRANMNDNVTITKLADVRTICISCQTGSGSYRERDYTSSYFYDTVIAFHHEKTDAREAFITLTIKLINRLHKNNLLQILLLSAHLYFNFHLKKKQNNSLLYQKNIKIVKGRVRRVRLKIINICRR